MLNWVSDFLNVPKKIKTNKDVFGSMVCGGKKMHGTYLQKFEVFPLTISILSINPSMNPDPNSSEKIEEGKETRSMVGC